MTRLQRGAVIRTANAWDGLRSGTITATTIKQPLSTARIPVMEVIVQNAPSQQVNVLVGDTRSQEYELISGADVRIKVNDLSTVYVRTAAGTATVNWLAGE